MGLYEFRYEFRYELLQAGLAVSSIHDLIDCFGYHKYFAIALYRLDAAVD